MDDKDQTRSDAADRMLTAPMEEVDAELRALGLDPEVVGARGAAHVAAAVIAAIDDKERAHGPGADGVKRYEQMHDKTQRLYHENQQLREMCLELAAERDAARRDTTVGREGSAPLVIRGLRKQLAKLQMTVASAKSEGRDADVAEALQREYAVADDLRNKLGVAQRALVEVRDELAAQERYTAKIADQCAASAAEAEQLRECARVLRDESAHFRGQRDEARMVAADLMHERAYSESVASEPVASELLEPLISLVQRAHDHHRKLTGQGPSAGWCHTAYEYVIDWGPALIAALQAKP